MNKVIILSGIPGSGKSTWAGKYQKEHDKCLILNRDSLREMFTGGVWSKENEEIVREGELSLLRLILNKKEDYTIIVDDTNLVPKTLNTLIATAKQYTEQIDIKDFYNVNLKDCIQRDSLRTHPVGHEVIERMYEQMLQIKAILKR